MQIRLTTSEYLGTMALARVRRQWHANIFISLIHDEDIASFEDAASSLLKCRICLSGNL